MAERPSGNPELKIPTLGGLNERPSPANLQAGQFDVLEGLYPAQIGLLRRIPNRLLLASFTGKILAFGITDNANGDILVATGGGNLYVITRDELLGRATTPSLTFTPIAEEETMSYALIVQKETNAIVGGSIDGFLSGAASTASVDTFYPRRLTHKVSDADSIVSTFTAAGAGAGAASSGSFALPAGSYRISAWVTFRLDDTTPGADGSFLAGLYNVTDSTFQVHAGGTGSDPILSTVESGTSTGSVRSGNSRAMMKGAFTIAGTKTFQLYQKCSNANTARDTAMGGSGANLTSTTNLGGVAAPFYYTFVEILKTA